jgi:hypothetical protein
MLHTHKANNLKKDESEGLNSVWEEVLFSTDF